MSEVILLSLLTFFFSVVLRYCFVKIPSSDEWVTLWTLKRYKKSKKIDIEPCDSLIHGFHLNPPLNLFFLSLLPESVWYRVGSLLNSMYDYLSALVLFFMLYVSSNNLESSLLLTSLFVVSPSLYPCNARLSSINSRSFGLLVVNLIFVSSFLIDTFYIKVLVCSLLVYIVIISSRFAYQVVFFFSVFLSLFYGYFFLLCSVILGSILALSTNVGKISLFQGFFHKSWYLKNVEMGTTAQRPSILSIVREKSLKKLVLSFFIYNPILVATILYFLPFVVIASLFDFKSFTFSFVVCGIATFLIISIDKFSFLGQAERYLSYTIFPLILSINKIDTNLIYSCLIISLIINTLNLYIFRKTSRVSNVKYFDEVVSFLKLKPSMKILTIPVKSAFAFSYLTEMRHSFYFRFIIKPKEKSYDYMTAELQGEDSLGRKSFEIPRKSIEYFIKTYSINCLIIKNNTASNSYHRDVLGAMSLAFENKEYKVYEKL